MKINSQVTDSMCFYQGHDPINLIETYASPLYVYNENIFRQRCREMMKLSSYPNFVVNYAIKSNSNLNLLKIAKEEGLRADVSSQGETIAAFAAGFTPDELFFIVNNVSPEELQFAVDHNVMISVDSLSQLETLGKLLEKHGKENRRIALRFNTGIGGGHSKNVVTSGDGTKFGIMSEYIPQVKELLKKYDLSLVGINHHIGSLNWGELYLEGAKALLDVAHHFENLEFIDLGGGFAIPYHKQDGEKALDLEKLSAGLTKCMYSFAKEYGKQIQFMIEPGRYISAECGVLLGTVHSIKDCGCSKYAGTDIGFSVLLRTTLYDTDSTKPEDDPPHHDIEVYRSVCDNVTGETETITIVGNQCESGDYIAKDRCLPKLNEGDILGVLDAGAYGYSMSSTYNMRLRPAEVLICSDDSLKLVRKRDTYEGLIENMIM